MAIPLIPIAAGVVGATSGIGISSLLGLGKKGDTITTTTTQHAPYETYAPQTQYAPVTSYAYQGATYIISSPGAESKKAQAVEQTSAPSQAGSWEVPQMSGTSMGLDSSTLLILGIIAGVAVIGYGVVSKK